ncbi:MAG: hypothetical protein AAF204_03510 [Pseudomonadota bacterium]
MPDPDELVDIEEHPVEDIPEAVKPIPEGSSVPALPDEEEEDTKASESKLAKLIGYLGAFVVFLLVLCVLVILKPTLLKTWPASAALYEMMGVDVTAPGQGLVFDQVKARMVSENTIEIEGKIINITSETQMLPAVEASIRNEAGDTIKKTVIKPPYETLDGESTLPFKSMYQGETEAADHVQIRFVLTGYEKTSKNDPKTSATSGDNNQALPADGSAQTRGDEAR